MRYGTERKAKAGVWRLLVGMAAVAASAAGAPSARAVIVIDPFITVQNASVDQPAPVTAGSSVAAPFSIGGERDLFISKTFGADEERFRVRINPQGATRLRMNLDEARGIAVLTWDGPDGQFQPNQVNFSGLGGIDFTTHTALEIIVNFSDVGGPIHFTFWDALDLSGGTFATTTFNVPAGIPSESLVSLTRNFADFVPTGGSLASILSRVGAIQMRIDASNIAQEGWDLQLDVVQAIGQILPPLEPIPEPSSLLCFGILGLAVSAAGAVRRRKSA